MPPGGTNTKNHAIPMLQQHHSAEQDMELDADPEVKETLRQVELKH